MNATNDQTPGRPGCDGNDRSRGMTQEFDIAALRKAAPNWKLQNGMVAIGEAQLAALLDRLEQAEKDAARYRAWRDAMCAEDERFFSAFMGRLDDIAGGDWQREIPPTAEQADAAIDAAMQGEGA